ncbi:MAG: dephospho-CoA kinase [Erysipelotrichaceae bacterium]|nr:dephospho-CoA kinase [Erysipelotrichaceae bacterium]MCI9524320.1 dephospho-CoA kinase [Erysipelotrichaceae bacterium]
MLKTKKIGLTGVMGAGKSSVIKLLKEMQIPVEDCDQINAQLLSKQGKAYSLVVQTFGNEILDENENIDAQKLSHLIFDHPLYKKQLEQIVHPLIKTEIIERCIQCTFPFIVIEVPLLFEVKWESFFDEVWVVSCAEEVLLKRLETYRHVKRIEAKKRLRYQMPQKEKCERADVVFYNDKGFEHLRTQIMKEVKRLEKEG